MDNIEYKDQYYDAKDLHCPYCLKNLWREVADGATDDVGFLYTSKYACGYCKNMFAFEKEIVFNARTDCGLNNKKHEFIPSALMDGYENKRYVECKNCATESGGLDRLEEKYGKIDLPPLRGLK